MESSRLDGRVCVVTGASSGIGRAAAVGLAARGATIALVARNPDRGRSALAEVQAFGRPASLHLADLSEMSEVRGLAAELLGAYGSISVLINNAGVLKARREVTSDGFEHTLALDHLAPFLLTNLLLERLRASAPARVITVSSGAAGSGRIAFEDLQSERRYRSFAAYSQAKLANILFTYELARRLAGTGVTATCLHPGVVRTGWGRGQGLVGLVTRFGAPFMKTPEQGAATVIWAAAAPELEQVSGAYLQDCRIARSAPASYDEAVARRLWQVSEELTGLASERV